MTDAPTRRGRAAIVVAGGTGERFGEAGGKQLALIAGKPALTWSIEAMLAAGVFETVVVVCHPQRVGEYRTRVEQDVDTDIPLTFVAGGATRQDSVGNGLRVVPEDCATVAVHDGARPLVEPSLVRAVVIAAEREEIAGAVAGHPSIDTLKVVDHGVVTQTPDRARIWAAQTPQAFKAVILREAYERAGREGFVGTDDASLVEHYGGTVIMVEGGRDNIKITLPEDVVFAEAVLRARGR